MSEIQIRPISAQEFAPFGTLLAIETGSGTRFDFSHALQNKRPDARPRACLISLAPTRLPLRVEKMERHQYSSQAFVPSNCAEYVVFVAPSADGFRPDVGRALAFRVPGNIGISYHADVWHYPMTVLGAAAEFAMIMFADGSDLDEEFVPLDAPITLVDPDQ